MARALACALLISSTLTNCATNKRTAPEPGTRQLPPAPSYLQPIKAPPVKEGDNLLVVAKQRGQIINRQNRIIVDTQKWIEGVRQTYRESFIPKNVFGF